MTTVIVGAGVTGLTIGTKLLEQGMPCTIVERDQEVGGLARSYELNGAVFDLGPHLIFQDGHPEATEFIKKILRGKYYELDLRMGIHFSGHYHSWPPSIVSVLLRLPTSVAIHHLLRSFSKKTPKDDSVRTGMIMRHGEYLYQEFFSPYIAKKTGISGANLHMDWWLKPLRHFKHRRWYYHQDMSAGQRSERFVQPSMLLWKLHRLRSKVLYPHGGMQALPTALAEIFSSSGGSMRTGITHLRLKTAGNRIRAVALDGGEEIPVKRLVWTAPPDVLGSLLGLSLPQLPYLPVLLCFIRLNRRAESRGYLLSLYSDSNIIFNRAYFPANISKHLVPAGEDAVCLEITPLGSGAFENDDQLKRRAVAHMEKVGLCLEKSVQDIETLAIDKAYPLYALVYKDMLANLLRQISLYDNIWLAGRIGAFYNIRTDGSIQSGLDVARDIIAEDRSG